MEKKCGEQILATYKVGGQPYVDNLRLKLRHLEANRKWQLYYSLTRSIKWAMELLEETNAQWPMALLNFKK